MSEISVLINNYNYAGFIGDAIRSVLNQTFADFELIIVDDGSTDNSMVVISEFNDPRIKTIGKKNGGQLSAFNAGFSASSGRIVCFLDADDLYRKDYLERVFQFFTDNPDCDCLIGRVEYFGEKTGTDVALDRSLTDGYIGCAPFSVAVRHIWRGAPTSAYSIRREFLAKFLPYQEDERFWITRADDLLVWGADLVNAVKYCSASLTVLYRIHGNNYFFGKKDQSSEGYQKRKAAAERFCAFVMQRNHLDYPRMLKDEIRKGNTSFSEKILAFLKTVRDRMMSASDLCKCAWYLFLSLFYKFGL